MMGINWSRDRIPALPDRALLEYARLEYANEEPLFLRARALAALAESNGVGKRRRRFSFGSRSRGRPDPAAGSRESPGSA